MWIQGTSLNVPKYQDRLPWGNSRPPYADWYCPPNLPMFRKQPNHTAYIEDFMQSSWVKTLVSIKTHFWTTLEWVVPCLSSSGGHCYKKWTRQQMIDFMREHSASLIFRQRQIAILPFLPKIQNGPTQNFRATGACETGDRFDIKAFHDMVLNAGTRIYSMPVLKIG